MQGLIHDLDKAQGEARAAAARADAADAEVVAREQLLAAARVRVCGRNGTGKDQDCRLNSRNCVAAWSMVVTRLVPPPWHGLSPT